MSELKFTVIDIHSRNHTPGSRGHSSFRIKGTERICCFYYEMKDCIHINIGGIND
jgi:hypothetical protein